MSKNPPARVRDRNARRKARRDAPNNNFSPPHGVLKGVFDRQAKADNKTYEAEFRLERARLDRRGR